MKIHNTLLIVSAALSSHLLAAPIYTNNFNSDTAGTVPTGLQQDFSTATVTSANGIDGTNGFGFSSGTTPVNVSTTATYDVTTIGEVGFTSFFEYNGNTQTGGGFAMGWSDSSDGINYYNLGSADRVLIGVTNLGSGDFGLGYEGQLNNFSNELPGAATFSLASGNWYEFDGSLEYTGLDGTSGNSLWNYSMTLTDYGANGTVVGSQVATLSGSFEAAGFGSTLTLTAARAAIATNEGRGTNLIDNVNIAVIPEPGTLTLLGLAFGALVVMGRNRRKA